MIIFHGGFNKKQVLKLRNNKYILYKKDKYETFNIKNENTFKYYEIEEKSKRKEKIEDMIEQNYLNQWIHCFKYLENALYFCKEPYNYIVAFELSESLIEKYKGVGNYKYEGYKLEYRIPRKEINSTNIIDVFRFEYFDSEVIKKLKEKYPSEYSGYRENEEAKKLLKAMHQKCKYL